VITSQLPDSGSQATDHRLSRLSLSQEPTTSHNAVHRPPYALPSAAIHSQPGHGNCRHIEGTRFLSSLRPQHVASWRCQLSINVLLSIALYSCFRLLIGSLSIALAPFVSDGRNHTRVSNAHRLPSVFAPVRCRSSRCQA
jgi:hypothetical protein